MVFSIKKFRHYLVMNLVVFFVDHLSLWYMVKKPNHSDQVAQWVLLLDKFDYTIEYMSGRLHKHIDHLSRLSIELETVDIDNELMDVDLFLITIVPL